MTNEAFARIKIDQLLKDTDWRLTDGISVRYEYPLDDGGRADYALFDRQGRALAVLEAKSTSVSLSAGEAQGRRYADLLDVPFIFLSNGEEIWFCDMGVLGKPKFYIPGFLLSLFEAFDLMSIASGSTVPQLNKQDLHPLNKIVPPLQLQIDFAERADRLESLARHLDAAAAKAEELLDRVRAAPPDFFERLIVNLLLTMGYGGSAAEAGRALGRSGDDGVDGVIDQDALGLDRVYIQAKRYAAGNSVGPGAIRDFFGSLDRHKAAKGLFVTTSGFTSSARETADYLSKRIVLIDGEQLTRLMIRHNVGCRIEEVLHVKKVDEDFFE